jgi:2-dehydropantoate 2-reductase
MMRMLIVGAGSTGGYFGARLADAGRDVTFLVRPGRAAHLRTHGLQILSPHGDLTLRPQLVTADEIAGPYDIVLLTVKAFSLEAALDDLAPAVGPETMIMPVLNGMKHMDLLAGRFGAERVIGGVCKVATAVDEAGRIRQLNKFQSMTYGELDGSESARIRALDAFMRGAGFDARLSPAIAREMWEKWILLAALGGVTCLMRGTIGDIVAAPGGTDFITEFLDEVVSVTRVAGVAPDEAYVAETREILTQAGSPQTSSMYRDLQQGSRIEADQIIGDLLARGRKATIATPLLALAYTHLTVYRNRLAAA